MMTNLVHCSYHKCMTVYYKIVFENLLNRFNSDGYRHFNSQLNPFYSAIGSCRLASINNHALDLSALGDFRLSRFIRDPRDLVVSGYFYHRKGAESWSEIKGPTDADWVIVNGHVPDGIGVQESFSEYLQRIPLEDGLIEEINFRKYHFLSMLQWPEDDDKILLLKYEDILDNEKTMFRKLMDFYGFSFLEKQLGSYFSGKHSIRERQKRKGPITHVRNPGIGQWREVFTPKVTSYFNARYRDVLEAYAYPAQ